ncbi:unnamed protein product [Lymnaea stagnalis]|uniref:Uncharacterized protein n=1 Tax=Lymnaea stagnalis TaxID=6523 RepID=A0AAV2HVC3_LYMST
MDNSKDNPHKNGRDKKTGRVGRGAKCFYNTRRVRPINNPVCDRPREFPSSIGASEIARGGNPRDQPNSVFRMSLLETPRPTADAENKNVETKKDKELIEAASYGLINNFVNLLTQLKDSVTQFGYDIAAVEATRRGSKLILQHLLRAGARTSGTDDDGNTALMLAAEKGFLEMARILLKKGANVNAVNNAGQTALLLSIRPCGASDMISLLVANKADVNAQCKNGHTALIEALERKDLDAVKVLIDAGADMGKLRTSKSETAMDVAKRLGIAKVVLLLKEERGAGKYKKNNKLTALMKAALTCNVDAVGLLLDCSFTDVNRTVSEGSTLMQVVRALSKTNVNDVKKKIATASRIEIIKLLLQYGAHIDEYHTKDGSPLILATRAGQKEIVQLMCQGQTKLNAIAASRTALMIAAETGRVDLLTTLINAGADLGVKNSSHQDALLIALKCGHVECAKVLLQHNAVIDVKEAAKLAVGSKQMTSLQYLADNYNIDVNRSNLLHQAIIQDCEPMVKLLIDMGADVNKLDEHETPPLLLACSKGVSYMELLIKKGADVNLGHRLTGPPLIRAMSCPTPIAAAELLIEHGADVNKTNRDGECALMHACSGNDNQEMVNILIKAGANVNLVCNKGGTCLQEAVKYGSINVAKTLLEQGADVNAKCESGMTAFLVAAEAGNIQILKLLQQAGADVNLEDNLGNNALLRALSSPDTIPDVVSALAFSKEHLNKQNSSGYTPLMMASDSCNVKMIDALIDLGADVNILSRTSNAMWETTALSVVLEKSPVYKSSDFMCIESLVKQGAVASLPSRCRAVLHKMIILDNRKIIQLLVTHGMSPCNVDLRPVSYKLGPLLQMQMVRYSLSDASPLNAALASGNVKVARYFAGNWFLSPSDLAGFSHRNNLREFLIAMDLKECVEFVDEFTSQPMSLLKLSFVAVSAAVGPPPGREARVRQLPLPAVMQDKLLFKNEEVQLDLQPDGVSNRMGMANLRISDDDSEFNDHGGIFLDYDDPLRFMYDSDTYMDYESSVGLYDSDDTYMYL